MVSRLAEIKAKVMCCMATMSVKHSQHAQSPGSSLPNVTGRSSLQTSSRLFGQILKEGWRSAYSNPGPARGGGGGVRHSGGVWHGGRHLDQMRNENHTGLLCLTFWQHNASFLFEHFLLKLATVMFHILATQSLISV